MPQAFAEKVDQSNPSDSIGLTSQEAQERLRRFGANDPAPARRHSVLTELLFLFVNPLGIILLIAAVISGFIGQLLDAGIIVAMVLVGAGINFLPNLPVENRHREPESKGRTHSYRSTGRSLAGIRKSTLFADIERHGVTHFCAAVLLPKRSTACTCRPWPLTSGYRALAPRNCAMRH